MGGKKGGRPRIVQDETQDTLIAFRSTSILKRHWENEAERRGMTLSGLIRSTMEETFKVEDARSAES